MLYDFRCEKCGHEIQLERSMNDQSEAKCPQKKCGGSMNKRIYAPNISAHSLPSRKRIHFLKENRNGKDS